MINSQSCVYFPCNIAHQGYDTPAMAEAVETCDFDVWLKDTLVNLNTDDEVFSPYIKGILEGDESSDEKFEALQGILEQITVSIMLILYF